MPPKKPSAPVVDEDDLLQHSGATRGGNVRRLRTQVNARVSKFGDDLPALDDERADDHEGPDLVSGAATSKAPELAVPDAKTDGTVTTTPQTKAATDKTKSNKGKKKAEKAAVRCPSVPVGVMQDWEEQLRLSSIVQEAHVRGSGMRAPVGGEWKGEGDTEQARDEAGAGAEAGEEASTAQAVVSDVWEDGEAAWK